MNKTRQRFTLGTFGVVEFDSALHLSENCYGPIAPSCKEMALLDLREIHSCTSSLELMERAARVVVEEIQVRFPSASSFIIFVGPGNNGGDGLAVARLLIQDRKEVSIVAVTSEKRSKEWEAQAQLLPSILWFPTVPSNVISHPDSSCKISEEELLKRIKDADVVIDALLGIGQNRAPQGALASLVSYLSNDPRLATILSIDQPTGVNSDTGEVYSPSVHAEVTVSIQAIKRGMLQFPARSKCGDIIVRDIGIDTQSNDTIQTPAEFTVYLGGDLPEVRTLPPDIHKGKRGSVLVIGGSQSMPGAPALTALAALRTGAGVVTVVSKRSWGTFEYLPPEVMRVVSSSEATQFTSLDIPEILLHLAKCTAVVIGPGIGDGAFSDPKNPTEFTQAFTRQLLEECAQREIPVVLDASGIHHVVGYQFPKRRSSTPNRLVLTPHPGEAAALIGCTTNEIQRDRFTAVKSLAQKSNGIALLKGAGTLLHNGQRGCVVPHGTPYLATAGSGDVLAGVVAAYLAKGVEPYRAAAAAVYHHASAGCAAAQKSSGVIASDIAHALGEIDQITAGASEKGR